MNKFLRLTEYFTLEIVVKITSQEYNDITRAISRDHANLGALLPFGRDLLTSVESSRLTVAVVKAFMTTTPDDCSKRQLIIAVGMMLPQMMKGL